MVYPTEATNPELEMRSLHQAYLEKVRQCARDAREWGRAMDQLASGLSTGSTGRKLTPLERLYLYCHVEVALEPRLAALLQPVIRKHLTVWPDDFFLLYAETELSNFLGVESPHREDLLHAILSAPSRSPVPFEHHPSRSDPVLSICVSTWNRLDSLRRLLESLRLHTHVPYEVLICDNGSTDGTREYLNELRKDLPELATVLSLGHRTTLEAYRLAFSLARGSIVGALADDTEVTAGWDAEPVQVLTSNPRIGVATPLVLEADGVVDRLGSCVPYTSTKHSFVGVHGPLPHLQGVPPDRANLPAAPFESEGGAYPFLRREVLSQLNLFDSRYVHVWDNDLAIESRSKGFRNVVCPSSRIIDHRVTHQGPRVDENAVGDSFATQLLCDPDSALSGLRSPDSIIMRYFRDDFLLQCKWWAYRIRPCNRQP